MYKHNDCYGHILKSVPQAQTGEHKSYHLIEQKITREAGNWIRRKSNSMVPGRNSRWTLGIMLGI
jgi:hypothetical protein